MRYDFTRTVAHVKITLGTIIMVTGLVLAIVMFAYPAFVEGVAPQASRRDLAYRVLSAALLLGAGVVIGTAFIVLGQLVLVLLDIRARLVRIDRRFPRRQNPEDPRSPVAERMRPRL